MSKHYRFFSVQDFAQDDYFIQWVRTPNADSDAFWQKWKEDHPYKKEQIDEARALVLLLNFDIIEPSTSDLAKVKERIDSEIHNVKPSRSGKLPKWYLAAALVFLFVSVWLINNSISHSHLVTYTTMYGETKMVVLPDNSTVIVNANSTISFVDNWEESETREVWLDGEAFFDVKKMPHLLPGDSVAFKQFLVHSGVVNVEVLGTSFNINNRNEAPKIVLSSGQISLEIPTETDTAKMYMVPGDFVQYVSSEKQVITKKVDPEKYTSWTDYKLHFEETSLLEVAEIIKENFGKQVVFESEELQDIKLSGTVSTQSLDVFVNVLSESIDRPIIAKGNRLIIKN